jgi:hypothetical protein
MIDETELDEKAEVLAIFRRNQLHNCQPLKFRLKNREIEIAEIGLVYPIYKKGVLTHIFDVTDGSADYRLELNTKLLTWKVTREADRYE